MGERNTTGLLLARGKESFARGAYVVALADLEEVAGREPRFADVHHLIGLCLRLLDRPDAALDAFDRALAINPRYVQAQLSRAIVLNDLGREAEARESFEHAAKVDRETGWGRFTATTTAALANRHAELGDFYAAAGALPEAVEQYRRACTMRPQFVDLRNRLARALIDLRQTEAAIRELREVLELAPRYVDARANLGLALFRSGAFDAARTEWERCLADRPTDPQVRSYLNMLARRHHKPAASALATPRQR